MSRKYIYYELETHEPMITGNSAETGNLLRTNDYIPGNTILGLFASLYLKKKKTAYSNNNTVYKDDFAAMFLSDTLHFFNAYPLHAETRIRAIPMPMTVFGCKHFGENIFNSREKQHGVFDMVFETVPKNFVCNVNGCNCEMKHKDGYLYYYEGIPRNLNVKKRIDAHINVDEEQLYAFEAVEKNTLFYGYIGICEENFEAYSGLLKELGEVNLFLSSDCPFRIGKAKSRGYGLIRLNYFNEEEYPFNKNLHLENLNGDNLLSVYCYSDIILKKSSGQYYSWIDPNFIHNDLEKLFFSF